MVTRTGSSEGLTLFFSFLFIYLLTIGVFLRYDEALSFHQQALVLKPLNPSTYSAIGFVQVIINNQKQQEANYFLQSLTGDLMGAVESFHKALGIRR